MDREAKLERDVAELSERLRGSEQRVGESAKTGELSEQRAVEAEGRAA